jgi:hypothetical protein
MLMSFLMPVGGAAPLQQPTRARAPGYLRTCSIALTKVKTSLSARATRVSDPRSVMWRSSPCKPFQLQVISTNAT